MKPDITNLSVDELNRLKQEADSLIASKKDQEIANAYQDILAIAEKVGYTLDELVAFGSNKRKKSTAPRKAVAPRYRNTANASETWTGRGKQPRWLTAQLAQGKTLQDFLI